MTRKDFLKLLFFNAGAGVALPYFLGNPFSPAEAQAAGQKISARTSATQPLSGSDIFALIQGGLDRKADLNALFGISGIETTSRYGIVNSTTVDQTTLFQAFLNEDLSSGNGISKLKVWDGLHVKTTAPLTLPATGTRLTGVGSGGDFANYIIPFECRAFTFSSVHNIELSNFMIWPQGTTPPTELILLDASYNIRLNNLFIHLASTYVPSTAAVIQQANISACNDILFDHFILRSDGSRFPIGFQFANACGTCVLENLDLETCDRGIQHNGGKISLLNPYTERFGVHVVELQPSADANASFYCSGGQLVGDGTSEPIAIRNGAKNTRIVGTYCSRGGASGVKQGHIYGLTGSSNCKIDLTNYDAAQWDGSGDTAKLIFHLGSF